MSDLGYSTNPTLLIGAFLCLIGILIFYFGKKWFIFRWFLHDRSMFSKIGYGLFIFLIGCVVLYFSGFFND